MNLFILHLQSRLTHRRYVPAIQGIGGGGIINLTEIITSDLVPLAERGLYQGILGLTWSFASGVGPPIVGSMIIEAFWTETDSC